MKTASFSSHATEDSSTGDETLVVVQVSTVYMTSSSSGVPYKVIQSLSSESSASRWTMVTTTFPATSFVSRSTLSTVSRPPEKSSAAYWTSTLPPSTRLASSSSEEAATLSDTELERTSSPRARKIAIGLSVPAAVLLLIACILIVLHFRRQAGLRSKSSTTRSSRRPSAYRHDYNAAPPYPRQPLAGVSKSALATNTGQSYGATSKTHTSSVPQLPELRGLTAAEDEAPQSSDDDFDAYFSGLDDPFTDEAVVTDDTREETPGISPSTTNALRNRLDHDSGRRKRAIQNVKRSGSVSKYGSVRSRRTSLSEQELGELLNAFDMMSHQTRQEMNLRPSKSLEVTGGGNDSISKRPAELETSIPLV